MNLVLPHAPDWSPPLTSHPHWATPLSGHCPRVRSWADLARYQRSKTRNKAGMREAKLEEG